MWTSKLYLLILGATAATLLALSPLAYAGPF